MTSRQAVEYALERLRQEAPSWPGLISASVHGSMAERVGDVPYSDVDILFLAEDHLACRTLESVEAFFAKIQSAVESPTLRCFFRIESGPMHPLRPNESEEMIPLSERRVVFFHVSVFPLQFYLSEGGYAGPSPLLLRTWSNVTPLFGRPLRELRAVETLSIDDVLNQGLGVLDCKSMIEASKRRYWLVSKRSDGTLALEWRETRFQDYEHYDIPAYATKWAQRNVVEAISRYSVPLSRTEGAHGDKEPIDSWLACALVDAFDELRLLDSWSQNAQELRVAFSEDPRQFTLVHPPNKVRSAALKVLVNIQTLLQEVNRVRPAVFTFGFDSINVPIVIDANLGPQLLSHLERLEPDRVILIVDERVRALYDVGALLPSDLARSEVSIPAGEASKSADGLIRLLKHVESDRIGPASLIIVIGGGSIGNLGGVVAGLCCRGAPFVHVPTTLVSQLDSAISAKQSVNGWLGKNYFGLYHPPAAVIVNPVFLASLPTVELRSGLTEALKHGFCQSDALVGHVLEVAKTIHRTRPLDALSDVVAKTISLKLEYMRDDPRESAPDQFLELGHKVGHAIEHLAAGRVSHGLSIAVGMLAEAHFFVSRGESDPVALKYIETALKSLWCQDAQLSRLDSHAVANQLTRDNKRRGLAVPFACLSSPQAPIPITVQMDEEAIDELARSISVAIEALT